MKPQKTADNHRKNRGETVKPLENQGFRVFCSWQQIKELCKIAAKMHKKSENIHNSA